MLAPDDELPHPAPVPFPTRWQENYFVLGWDDTHQAGFTVHLERFPDRGVVEVKADVVVAGDVTAATRHVPLPAGIGAGPVEVEVAEPFRRWRLRCDTDGIAGRGPLGFVGVPRADGAARRFGLDVTLDSPLGAVDHREMLVALDLPGTERDHYETCGTWTGTVWAGEHSVTGAGHFVRDHTWGVRGYSAFTAAWWYPSVFDDGESYFGGALVRYGDRWGGYAIVADDGGIEGTTDVAIECDADPRPCSYDRTRLRATFPARGAIEVMSTTRVHLPHAFFGFADRYFANDALSVLEWDGRAGFGLRELNGFLDAADAARLGQQR